ncbi:MAG: hypothetical protein HY099_05805 [Nitrospirae bacterium]|nr:hypothetical protein [Nitrospirota bacterium]
MWIKSDIKGKALRLKKQLLIFVFTIVVLSFFLVVSCGKKGEPTLTTFEKPEPVKNIKAVHRENEIIISWSYPVSEESRELVKGFYMEKAEDDGSKGFRNIAFLKNDVSQFVDREFKTGRTYLYRMRVYSIRNVISDASQAVKVQPSELPLPPAGLSYNVTNDSIEITWQGAIGNGQEAIGIRYNIYKSYEKGKYPASPLNLTPLKEPFFKDRVEPQKTSYYVIRSLRDTGIKDEGFPSEELEVNPESFMPSNPSGLKFVHSKKTVVLMWKENSEIWVNRYRIYRKRISEDSFKLIGEAVTPTFKDDEPLISKTLYYATAVGPVKESIRSEPVEVYPVVER